MGVSESRDRLDLSDVILNDADWMSVLIEESVEFNTVNGKLIAAPAYQDSYSGVWYNKEVFANAGVDEFPTTWTACWRRARRSRRPALLRSR